VRQGHQERTRPCPDADFATGDVEHPPDERIKRPAGKKSLVR